MLTSYGPIKLFKYELREIINFVTYLAYLSKKILGYLEILTFMKNFLIGLLTIFPFFAELSADEFKKGVYD